MVTPRKATFVSREPSGIVVPSTKESLRQLSQMHQQIARDRANWRAQLNAMRIVLERTSTEPQDTPLVLERDNLDNENKIIGFLRERCQHLEEQLDEEKRKSSDLKQQLDEERRQSKDSLVSLNRELQMERRKRRELADRMAEFVRSIELRNGSQHSNN